MNRLVLVSLLLFMAVESTQAGQYVLSHSPGTDTVCFRSTAKLEFIEGKTTNIDGSFTFDPARTSDSVSGRLRVDLRTLKTGIDMRDEHMRERHLQTDQFPFAYFELTGIKGLPARLTPTTPYKGKVEGWFYIHGVKRKIEADVDIVENSVSGAAPVVTARVRFAMNLDTWKIPRPKALFLKLAETVDVEVFFTAHPGVPTGVIELPAWPEIP
jgi:polyisoprenoid-binding protein YceI